LKIEFAQKHVMRRKIVSKSNHLFGTGLIRTEFFFFR